MKQSYEVEYCKNIFNTKRRSVVLALIEDSSLNNFERDIIQKRYIDGLSIKQMCLCFNIEEEAYKKQHRKILTKFYNFIITNELV